MNVSCYNGALIAGQFLFYEIRMASRFFLQGIQLTEAIRKITSENFLSEQRCEKILLPITSAADLGVVPPDLMGAYSIIFYATAQEAVFKALGAEQLLITQVGNAVVLMKIYLRGII